MGMRRIWQWLVGKPPATIAEAQAQEARKMIVAGVGLSALAAVEIAAGSICPICVVAAPTLLTVGTYKRLRARTTEEKTEEKTA